MARGGGVGSPKLPGRSGGPPAVWVQRVTPVLVEVGLGWPEAKPFGFSACWKQMFSTDSSKILIIISNVLVRVCFLL